MHSNLSVIIPVLNEQRRINPCISHLKNQVFHGRMEIIVSDGHPEQTTIRAITDPDVVRVVSTPGRGCQLNTGAGKASCEILLFLHCDTRLPENGIETICQCLEDPEIQAGAFDLSIDSPKKIFRVIEKSASLRSRITQVPYGDQCIFIRRAVFHALKGFAEIPIMEDVELMQRLRKKKWQIRILRKRVLTSARRWETEGILKCTLRNWTIMSWYLMGVRPDTLVRYYRPAPRQKKNR